jgi:hypothetical protein
MVYWLPQASVTKTLISDNVLLAHAGICRGLKLVSVAYTLLMDTNFLAFMLACCPLNVIKPREAMKAGPTTGCQSFVVCMHL